MKFLNVPTEFKAAGDNGEFTGYASMFGNVDLGGDVIERGAFKEIVKNAAGKVVVLWQHATRSPIGVADVKQDDKGLSFTGSLVLEDPQARTAQAHMKAGSVRGMSIGYDVLDGGAKILESGIRQLTGLKLWEISVVTFGMNPLAGVDSVKHASAIGTIRDYEDFLRDVGGFTGRQAKLLASAGYGALQSARDESGEDGAVKQLGDLIDRIKFPSLI